MNNFNGRLRKPTKGSIHSIRRKACNGKLNVTSVMAVDSHEDNQYELTFGSVNNNLKKSLESDFEDECSVLSYHSVLSYPSYSPDSSQLAGGSGRRKYNSLSKGISIEEFLVGQESGQLSAVDKLLMKNKAALESIMKQTRSKVVKEVAKPKKEAKPRKEKVLGSKIVTQKRTEKNDKPVKPKKEVKKVTKPAKEVLKTPKVKGKTKQDDKLAKKSLKKQPLEVRKRKIDADGKPILKKKLSKNERKTDLRSFKANASHKTRSFTKVKLRNGKSRIVAENNKPNPPRKYNRKSVPNVENPEALVNGKPPLKRPIKVEPLEDDGTVKRKRRKTEKLNQSVDSAKEIVVNGEKSPPKSEAVPAAKDARIIKAEFVEPIKQEVSEPENTIEEINVVNKDLVNADNIFVYRNTNEESNVSYVLQDLGSYVKEIERKTSKSDIQNPAVPESKKEIEIIDDPTESEDTECEEFSLQDANTESEDILDDDITLQYESDDNDDQANNDKKTNTPVTNAESTDRLPEASATLISDTIDIEPPIPPNEPTSQPVKEHVEKEPEDNAVKESILGALGLQSLDKVNQKKSKESDYTGTLKAVIKVDKGCRRMEMKQKESDANAEVPSIENVLSFYSKIYQNKVENDGTAGVDKSSVMETGTLNGGVKPHDDALLNSIREANIRPLDADYNGLDPVSGQLAKDKTKAAASLVVPEKSSSFSIHPNRLCSDVCKYCFGKFGSLDTPCHVGQMKNPERQRKILLCEPNLKLDTCLCDACYRYVDRKANKPATKRNKSIRRSISINPRTVCVIQNCNQFARHTVKRKWLLRISKKIAKLSFDVNKGGPGMRYGLCSQHYYLVDFYTLCGICKKRLNRNHMYSIRSELNDLNEILREDSIPIKLVDNMLLCKLCHYYMSLRLKYGSSTKMSPNNRQYYQNFRKKILIYYNVMVSDNEDTNDSECLPLENGHGSSPERTHACEEENKESTENKRSNVKKNHNVGIEDIASLLKPLEGDGDKNSTRIQVKFGNLNIGKLSNLNIGQNTQSEVKHEKSKEKELPLIADFCFESPVSGQTNWEKCVSTIQFDKGTKKLWQDLQKPYGNQSSFMRHLIMLEKYWRSGALVLSDKADAGAVKYINSVKNRIESLETSTSKPPPLQPVNVAPVFANAKTTETQVRHSAPPPLLKIDQMNGLTFVRKASTENQVKPITATPTSRNDVSLSQYAEMMHPQRTKQQLLQIANGHVQTLGTSLLRKEPSPMPGMNPILVTAVPTNNPPVAVMHKSCSSPSLFPPNNRRKITARKTSGGYAPYSNDSPAATRQSSSSPIPVPTNDPPVAVMHKSCSSPSLFPTNNRRKMTARKTSGGYAPYSNDSPAATRQSSSSPIPVPTNDRSITARKICGSMRPYSNDSPAATRQSSNSPIPLPTSNLSTTDARKSFRPLPTAMRKSCTTKTTHMPYLPSLTALSTNEMQSSLMIAKLPKALSVTTIDEPVWEKIEEKPALIPSPFLAGEKPSVSVFREISK